MIEARRLGACGVALIAIMAATLAVGDRNQREAAVFGCYVLGWFVFIFGYSLVRRVPEQPALRIVVGVSVALQAVAALWLPRTSDDAYRYAWDGRVGNSGIDPYTYAPNAPQLAQLRVPWLFPPGQAPMINRPDVPTIYPPFAQVWFRIVEFVGPDSWGIRPFQIAAGLVAVIGTLVLIRVLRAFGRDPRAALLWAWCPLVVLESGNNAHVDGLAAVLTVAALALLGLRRTVAGAVVLALAIGIKLTPALTGPSVVRRKPVQLLLISAGVLVASYLPHLLSSGAVTAGYLPGYLHEEGYDNGERFALLNHLFPQNWSAPIAVAILLSFTVWTVWKSTPEDPFERATAMVAVALLLATPTYPWYALLVVALCTAAQRPIWLALAAGAALPYLGGWLGPKLPALETLGYGIGGAVVAAGYLRASWVEKRKRVN